LVGQIGTGAVAERVALAALRAELQLAAQLLVVRLGQPLGRRYAEAVHEQRLRVFAARIQLVRELVRLPAHGAELEGDHVEPAGLDRLEIVREAEALALRLAREGE